MSSSESEDENLKNLMEAADHSLFNDALYCKSDHADGDILRPVDVPLSNRYLYEEENVFQSDLTVTESMKRFVGKKLSTLIENNISYVDVEPISISKTPVTESSGVKLLRGFHENLMVSSEAEIVLNRRQMCVPIKRRRVEDDSELSENQKIDQSVNWILSSRPNSAAAVEEYFKYSINKSSACWTNRPKSKMYEYRQNNKSEVSTLNINDEFSAARRKNNWEDFKIREFRGKR